MLEGPQRRQSLLYQLYITTQASRRFMRQALSGASLSGEEFALYSYLVANGPRTLSRAARDLGMAPTTLADLVTSHVVSGDIERRAHPRDGRARLLSLTATGRERWRSTAEGFGTSYRALLARLAADGIDPETVYRSLDDLRAGLDLTVEALELESDVPA